jgi:hypothetical protein
MVTIMQEGPRILPRPLGLAGWLDSVDQNFTVARAQ